MKKIISSILILITVISIFTSCGKNTDNNNENSAQKEYIELMESFRNSDIYKTSFKYIEDYLKTIYKSTEYDIAIEPGKLTKADFDKYADFSTNADTRLDFFDDASLILTMSCKDTGYDQEEMAASFAKHDITGKLYDPATMRSYYYAINGRDKTCTKEAVPEA